MSSKGDAHPHHYTHMMYLTEGEEKASLGGFQEGKSEPLFIHQLSCYREALCGIQDKPLQLQNTSVNASCKENYQLQLKFGNWWSRWSQSLLNSPYPHLE